jgi:hypothetical protein
MIKKIFFFIYSIVNKMSNNCSLYRDVYNSSDCYEFATVGEMNGITGAVPIPASTAQRFYQTPSTVNTQGQVVNPEMVQQVANATGVAPAAVANVAAAAGVSPAAVAQFIRMNRGF